MATIDDPRPMGQDDRLAIVRSLEAIRSALHHHLDRLEAQVQASAGRREDAGLRRRLIELEADLGRSRAEAERARSRADAILAEVEEERGRLAAAWEQLERERIALAMKDPGPRVLESVPATRRGSAPASGDHPITHAMLQQYQALRRDVRTAAEERQGF